MDPERIWLRCYGKFHQHKVTDALALFDSFLSEGWVKGYFSLVIKVTDASKTI